MSDRVVGIAVLDWEPGRPSGYLYFVCESDSEPRFIATVPVVGDGAPDPNKDRPYWRFRGDGELLHCYPSVRMSGAHEWHNTYNWSVPHVRYREAVKLGSSELPYDVLVRLNRQPGEDLW